ncbi:hypothetical protein HY635_02215 [Candidatus Uhrbacteria bacterium]|nr:hypothetical protein [Candidatus Uhrbacteria bacterium]
MEFSAAAVQPIRNPQCAYCADSTRAVESLLTRPESIDEFPLDASPNGLVWVEVICHGRREVTSVFRAVIELGESLSGGRRACMIREPEPLRRAYRALRGCALQFDDAPVAGRLIPKLVVGGFLVIENGNATGHIRLPIAHIIQHFARCG